jgi:hypothetical protein
MSTVQYNFPSTAISIPSFPLPTNASTASNQTDGSQKTQIVDGSGNVIASTNNSLNVNLLNGFLSTGNSSTTPLGISGSFTGTSADITNYSGVNILVATDRSGVLNMQFSSDGTNWDHDDAYACTVTTGGVTQSFYFQGAPVAKYFRVKYDNGATAQGVFRLQTVFKVNAGVGDIQDLTTVPVDASNGMVTKSVIYGKSTSGGVFVAVKANPTGALFADVSGSNVYAQQNGRWDITAITGTVSLPTGASTSANQTNGSQKNQIVDGSGNVIAATSNALNVSVQNASIPVTQSGTWNIGTVSTITNPVAVTGTFYQATQPVSIATAIPTKAPVNAAGSIVNTSLTATTASTASVPANAVGFVLEAPSTNTDNIRYAIGGTASTTVGMLMEPGRDTGFIPCAANISICATVSGTNAFSIQWVLSA